MAVCEMFYIINQILKLYLDLLVWVYYTENTERCVFCWHIIGILPVFTASRSFRILITAQPCIPTFAGQLTDFLYQKKKKKINSASF